MYYIKQFHEITFPAPEKQCDDIILRESDICYATGVII